MYINSIAHYIPQERVDNAYFKTVNGLDDDWIFRRTGIRTRSKAAEDETTNTMGVHAVKNAAGSLPYAIRDVDLIVTASYTPVDTVATLSHYIQHEFNIANARAIYLTTACSSLINAIEIVEGYFATNKATKALVVASEHNSAFNDETSEQSGHLWGDGAVALFISKEQCSDHDAYVSQIYTKGLGHLPKALTSVYLSMKEGIMMPDGKDVFSNACFYMIDALHEVLEAEKKSFSDLNFIAPHQANKRIITQIAHQLQIPDECFFTNIENYGNTGCPSWGISLSENLHRLKKGDLVGVTVFGGGYSCGAMLLHF